MEVTVKQETPAPPPKTYNITGLTQQQADFLFSLLGRVSSNDTARVFGHENAGFLASSKLYAGLRDGGAENTFKVSWEYGVISVEPV